MRYDVCVFVMTSVGFVGDLANFLQQSLNLYVLPWLFSIGPNA